MGFELKESVVKGIVGAALKEDAARNDVTSRGLFNGSEEARGAVIFKGQDGIFCGGNFARAAFREMDRRVRLAGLLPEGRRIKNNDSVLKVQGPASSILAAERAALNFLGHLSGIARLTRRYVDVVAPGSKAVISDTRKTHPLLRLPEKYAVAVGGGSPHRMDLKSMVMVKDNHFAVLMRLYGLKWPRVLGRQVQRWRSKGLDVEMEVDELKDLGNVIECEPDWIMLDNFGLKTLKPAVQRIRNSRHPIKIEISGGVRWDHISTITRLDIDRVSCGAVTHSAAFADFSLELG
ncbi:MAG: carboxylating nicotinate-nucleotide diphosphorylase [Elusimicrobia bacterium]|nr:carboxylating nicotinate-nucleotide diphosphorylase [Elusimicrobiota bacterium]